MIFKNVNYFFIKYNDVPIIIIITGIIVSREPCSFPFTCIRPNSREFKGILYVIDLVENFHCTIKMCLCHHWWLIYNNNSQTIIIIWCSMLNAPTKLRLTLNLLNAVLDFIMTFKASLNIEKSSWKSNRTLVFGLLLVSRLGHLSKVPSCELWLWLWFVIV